jgi:Tol biopolymer transport system component
MSMNAGTRLGAYEILSPLGLGGMGEVFRARDTKLNRDVAVKVLRAALADDPDRLARFQREAHVLASLNHPNIAQIYGLEDSGANHAIVMELVEGPTLADRIAQGPLPWAEARPIVMQIADALETAHEQGIIHRDLKPANIKVRPDGAVKVLDFGLAKALEAAPASAASAMSSPTITAATQYGVILGTAAYMSPEQAKGRPADKRSDVWGLGCVLYEMLTGRRPFAGDDVSDVLATVLKTEPDWSAFPADVPAHVQAVVKGCLQKERKARIPEVAAARFLLDEAPRRGFAETSTPPRRGAPWPIAAAIAATIVLTAAATAAYLRIGNVRQPAQITRFDVVLPPEQIQLRGIAISPDGRTIVYSTNRRMYVRTMSDVELRPLEGTAGDSTAPFFSADGKWVAFFSGNEAKLKKIALSGGAPVTICDLASNILGTTWTSDDQILVASNGIRRVSANGGSLETLIAARPGEVLQSPQLLPDGDHVVFAVASGNVGLDWDTAHIVVQSIKSGERRTLVEGGADPRVLASGRLLYALGSTILAVPFDLARATVSGAPVTVLSSVARAAGRGLAGLSLSATGTLAQIVGGSELFPRNRLALVDRDGKRTLIPSADGRFAIPRISPDGTKVAVPNRDERGNAFIWIIDLSGGASMRRLTFNPVTALVWSRDGQRIIFGANRDGGTALYSQPADGRAEERLTELEPNDTYFPNSVSADGKLLAFYTGRNGGDVWTTRLDGDRKLQPLVSVPGSHQDHASFSADGKWLAYRSNESGRYEIYVQPFPPSGAKYQVTTAGAHSPLWSPDGKQLFYIDVSTGVGRLTSVDVTLQPSFAASHPVTLPIDATFPDTLRPFDITLDAKRFVVVIPQADSKADQFGTLRITTNWFDELNARVPSGR